MRFELPPASGADTNSPKSSLLAGKKRPMLQAPTGAGKTMLAAAIVDGALAQGQAGAVHRAVPQPGGPDRRGASRQGIPSVGVMQGYHPRPTPPSRCRSRRVADTAAPPPPGADIVIDRRGASLVRLHGGGWHAGVAAGAVRRTVGDAVDEEGLASTSTI